MKIVCSWCREEGRPGVLGEQPPLDDLRETHSVCRRHLAALLNQIPSPSFPNVQLLLVVAPNEPTLYAHLTTAVADVRGVKVIIERRRGERRQDRVHVSHERRQGDRRTRHGEFSLLGYTMVRFRPRHPLSIQRLGDGTAL